MKLIDLLVQELPKRGGWPAGSACCCQSLIDTEIYFYDKMFEDGNVPMILSSSSFYPSNKERVHSGGYEYVSLQQYEAALKALEKFEWDGEGLPPIGVDCEYAFIANYREQFSRGKVLAYGESNVFMQHWASKNEFIQPLEKIKFRSIKTNSDYQREATIADMQEVLKGSGYGLPDGAAKILLSAIAQGKVSKLEYSN